ncbi:unnamed protein product [Staurois parvus]|uniref:Uncharacterized protein n=1 Tax=Staurois parvus TaxID=386267 RepID=A0ABN9E2D4_9NEOB|nr:unnamed protein product [Staurois parvus]
MVRLVNIQYIGGQCCIYDCGTLTTNVRGSHITLRCCVSSRGGLTIWKLGHCPRAQGQ